MVTAHDYQTGALPIMGRAQVRNSTPNDFERAFVVCFSMSAYLVCSCVG